MADGKIAVIGIACRFPGAPDARKYWDNLINGRESITHFTDEDLSASEYNYESLRNNPDYVKARGVLNGIDMFDADFFEMTPREAAETDPQHRIWLETAWHALEDAGCDPFTFSGAIGVYAGVAINTYLINNVLRDREKLENYIRLRGTESYRIMTGNDSMFIPTKTAYKFNLRGPAINVQTACSSSLVAISQACQSLFSYESDICLAGGIAIQVPQETGYLFQEGAIPSPDGKCRPFDSECKGTVFSNGVGIVVLKRIEDAVRDNDTIYSVIRGWALNNDGNKKVSYMAPGVEGQAEAILMAQSFAGVHPEEIGYIEAHGTATQLGDPIELSALNKVFARKTGKKQFCGVGSVKSNIGHTDAAAGIASFIKSAYSTYYRILPATINFTRPNQYFNFADSPFYVQDKLEKWNKKESLVIGISSFGIGGTNAHIIIEEPPLNQKTHYQKHQWPELMPVSAKNEEALISRMKDLAEHVQSNPDLKLNDIAFTLQTGRRHMSYRSFAVIDETGKLKTQSFTPPLKTRDSLPETAFMFSGQGSQYTGMGKELYLANSHFRQILDECFEIVKSETGINLKEILFSDSEQEENERKLASTDVTQPALFILEYALAKVYEDLGIRPHYLIGHSIGEFTAACMAGVFNVQDALRIVCKRGMLMKKAREGKMFAVRCSVTKAAGLNTGEFEIAADNSDNACTVSARRGKEAETRSVLERNSVKYIPLNTSHAFHSEAFDPILDEFEKFIDNFQLRAPEIPFVSCLTGKFITPEQAVSGKYWAQQLRNTVRFREGIISIVSQSDVVFLEVGPETHLTGLAKQNSVVANKDMVTFSLGKKDGVDELLKIMNSIGQLWANGIGIDFGKFHNGRNSMKISLPGYPFQRKRYWIDYSPSFQPAGTSQEKEETVKSIPEKKTLMALKALLCKVSGYPAEHIEEDTSFDKMGFDSLFLAQFAHNINEKFGVKIEFRQLISEFPTLNSLSGMIDSRKPVLKESGKFFVNGNKKLNNFVRFQPEGTRLPLVMLHGQAADTIMPGWFGKDQPYYGFLHPGSDGEKIGFTSVEEMAGAYLEQLLRNAPDETYCLGGFSFGGVLAYEMALQLEKMGKRVPYVLLFDSFAQREPFRWRRNAYRIVRSNILGPAKRGLERLLKMGVCETFIRFEKPTPLMFRNYYIIDRYKTLIKSFKPEKLNGEVILFRATENGSSLDCLGWDKYIDNIKVVPVKAAHISILENDENKQLVRKEMEKIFGMMK
ncbi:MAG TPA: beta-ketoacyl synthase N-terminal-like domain-containing protein [Bacteroidales bacterium]|nr:beta-ketoacyl synthase N-terminal-like domain-containing protein [Bacteroidales bacterium]